MKPKSLKQRTLDRHEALKRERSPWITDWQDVSDYVLGIRGRFLGDSKTSSSSNKERPERNETLYNETAKFASNTLASGMMAGITSPARPWFKLTTPDPEMMEYGPVKTWLDDVEKVLFLIFSRSNFYNIMHQSYRDIGAFGVTALGEYEDFDNVAHFESYAPGSYCLSLNGKRQVDSLFREYRMSVKSVVDKFGLDAVCKTTKSLYDRGNYEEGVDIVHVIEPNEGREFGSPLARNMPWRSVYFEKGAPDHQKPLRFSGFQEQAFFAPRWSVIGEDVYSVIYPGMDSMGTNKALQVQEMDKAIAIEKMHNPPLVGDAALANSALDLIAGGVSYVPNMAATGKPGLTSVYDVNPRIAELVGDIQEKENRIMRHFFADLFLMVTEMDRAQITATEIAERKEEKLLMLGPVLESLNNELLDPVIDRTFAMAQRAGILPEAPEELSDTDLKVEYISVLAQAQKAVSTASMESTAAFAMNLAQANPDAIDKIDMDQMIDEHSKAKGAPPKVIRSDDDVAEIREMRQQQMAQQQAMEQANMAAQGAKTLSEMDVSPDNALGLMSGAVT
jgi:hypothetical protein